jgi:pimeloyl-ACP methyl ester carboxylesterase
VLKYKIHRSGDQEPWVVFIHGAGGNFRTWKYQLEAFRGKANLLLLDLRDHGLSQDVGSEQSYDFDLIVSDILEVLDHESVEHAVFLTLSFGSVLLQALSLRDPGRVQAGIMAGAIFKANYRIRSFVYMARMINYILPYRMMYSLFSYLLMPRKSHQRSRRIYQLQARKLKPSAYMRWVGLYGEFFRLLSKFWHQDMTFPLLVAMGEHDYIFKSAGLEFSEVRGNVYFTTIPGAGHICNIDEPEIFNRISIDFLNRLGFFTDVAIQPSAEIGPE